MGTRAQRVIAAAAAALACALGSVSLAPAAHASEVVTPGDVIYVENTPTALSKCTVGPYVQVQGRKGFLTTGHCGDKGQRVFTGRDTSVAPLSTVGLSVRSGYTDVMFVPLSDAQMAPRAVLPGNRVVSGYLPGAMIAAMAQRGDRSATVCTDGATSGPRCGRALNAESVGLVVLMESANGDSGSAVWTEYANGYYVVGVLRGTVDTLPDHTVVEPIEELLKLVGGTLLTS